MNKTWQQQLEELWCYAPTLQEFIEGNEKLTEAVQETISCINESHEDLKENE